MNDFDWAEFGVGALQVFLLVLVGTGAIPVLSAALAFLAIPFHSFKNHYKQAAPYLPRVAIVVPAWNEGAVIGQSIERLMACLLYTSPSPRDRQKSRMPSSA